MAIDPVAVTGGAATKMPMETDLSAQSPAAVDHGAHGTQQPQATVGSGETVDLFEFARQQADRPLPLNALSAEGKAQHYANPTTLGEEVLNYLEGFHKRTVDYQPAIERYKAGTTSTAMLTPSGPASAMPSSSTSLSAVGSPGTDPASASEQRFDLMLDVIQEAGFRHTETNLVSNIGQQFSKAMGTLMRGQ